MLVEETDMPFTMYGVLNPMADTQWVHVFAIEGKLEPGTTEKLDATFTSTDLTTGETRTWTDSLLWDSRGVESHVFWSPFRVEHEHAYRVEVEHVDGRATHVEVTVPPFVSPIVRQAEGVSIYDVPLELRGEAARLLKMEVTLMGRGVRGVLLGGRLDYVIREITIPYGDHARKVDGGWEVSMDLSEAYAAVLEDVGKYVRHEMIEAHGLDLLLITMDAVVANEEWDPPGGRFDSLALAHPTVMTNVRNGFGFVGAGYRIRHQWRPRADLLVEAGFNPPS